MADDYLEVQEQTREQNTFRISEGWTKKDERQKRKALNKVFTENEEVLKEARRRMYEFNSPRGRASHQVGWLFNFAFRNLNSAANTAKTNNIADQETLDEIVDEFWSVVEPYDMTPHDLERLSEKANELGREPAKLRRVMRERGSKIEQLISYAYSGTEVTTEGSSDDEEDEGRSLSD